MANRNITIDEEADQPLVRVDGDRLEIFKLEDGSYYTPYLPYVTFDDLDNLVDGVVDNWTYVAPVVHGRATEEEEE